MSAGRDGISKDEMARLILGIEPANEPERARRMTKVGCRHLVAGQYPGAERDRARPVDLLQSLGILTTTPADGRIGR